MRFSAIALVTIFALSSLYSCSPKGKNKSAGGTFYRNLTGEPTTINPLTSTDQYGQYVHEYTLDHLGTRNGDNLAWEPALASSWTVSKDNKIFEFTLRPGVKWHDGKPLTVEDVKFSFDVIFDPQFNTAHMRPYFDGIEKAEIIGTDKIRFTAKTSYFQNFDVLAGQLDIIPMHIYKAPTEEQKKELNKSIVGSGPYKLAKFERGKRIILEQNPDWWGRKEEHTKNEHNFPKVVLRFVKDDSVALEMLKKGDLDFLSLQPEDYVKKTDGKEWGTKVHKVQAENKSPKGYNFIGWNMSSTLVKDKKVRIALAHLVNKQMMMEKFFYNLSDYAAGPLYTQSDYASPKVKPILYDPEAAAKLFKEAGWKDSDGDMILDKVINGKKEKMSLTIIAPGGVDLWTKILTVYKEDAKKAGVDINIKQVEWNSFMKLLDERKFDAASLAWGGGGIEWDPKQIWHSSSAKAGSNFIGYNNPAVDKLIDEARLIPERNKRTELLHKVFEMIADDAPYVFLFSRKYDMYAHADRILKEKDTLVYEIGMSKWKLKAE